MAQALLIKTGIPRSAVNDVLDLVAVGTVGDVVSLTDENRTIVKYGLNKINTGSRESLNKLKKAISLPWITSENIAFGIAPHINAAGRMDSAREAAELFLTDNAYTMDEKVEKLVSFNGLRKKKQEDAYNRCMEKLTGDEKFIMLHMDDIHEGIGGIVAGKIKESAYRPTVIVTPSGEGYLKGTGRSLDNIDIYGLLKKHEELFERFGGHRSACGFLMKEENIEELVISLDRDMEIMLKENPELFNKEVAWDMELMPEEITIELAEELEKMEPVGQGNPKPVFIIKDIIVSQPKFMGADGTHARFKALSKTEGGCECVLFKRAQELKELLLSKRPVELIGIVERQSWNGRERVQFIVEEMLSCK